MRCLALLLALATPIFASAQKTEADIKARLVDQPLYLRGQWDADKLAFDEGGQLQGRAGLVSFTLSGIQVESVKLNSKELDLEGQRVGLEFTKDVSTRVPLKLAGRFGGSSPEKVTIKIKAPADGDFTSALNAIFTDTVAGLQPPLPECWQQYARKHLLPMHQAALEGGPSQGDAHAPQAPDGAKIRKVGGGVTAPHVVKQEEPEFDPAARALKYSGLVLVSLIVGTDGVPTHVQVVRPAGVGLDERAVAAVSRYTFDPAMEGGRPVPVMLNVEVNFQIS